MVFGDDFQCLPADAERCLYKMSDMCTPYLFTLAFIIVNSLPVRHAQHSVRSTQTVRFVVRATRDVCHSPATGVAGIVLAAFFAIAGVMIIILIARFLVYAEEGGNHDRGLVQRVAQRIPAQSLKLVIVAWQILTQVRVYKGILEHTTTLSRTWNVVL